MSESHSDFLMSRELYIYTLPWWNIAQSQGGTFRSMQVTCFVQIVMNTR